MTSKFTPGPWHPGHFGEDGNCQCRTIVCEHLAGGIATVHVHSGIQSIGDGGNDCPPKSEAVANMHLLSAAPDMYEALADLLSSLEVVWSKGFAAREDLEPEIKSARAALSKAEGEA